jgi:hypothetical protein
MGDTVAPRWQALAEDLATILRKADRTITYLHLPKTGGTTLVAAMAESREWTVARLPASGMDSSSCSCGQPECEEQGSQRAIARLINDPDATASVFVAAGHETFSAIESLESTMEQLGTSLGPVLVTARPARDRLTSAFRDYWTQVDTARRAQDGTSVLARHELQVVRAYLSDSQHYARHDGTIDAVAWFRAFAVHGPGVPFLLSDVFGPRATHFVELVRSQRVVILPTSRLDLGVEQLTGDPPALRLRVSHLEQEDVIAAALSDAQDVISQIAAKDRRYDEFLADALGDEDFNPDGTQPS